MSAVAVNAGVPHCTRMCGEIVRERCIRWTKNGVRKHRYRFDESLSRRFHRKFGSQATEHRHLGRWVTTIASIEHELIAFDCSLTCARADSFEKCDKFGRADTSKKFTDQRLSMRTATPMNGKQVTFSAQLIDSITLFCWSLEISFWTYDEYLTRHKCRQISVDSVFELHPLSDAWIAYYKRIPTRCAIWIRNKIALASRVSRFVKIKNVAFLYAYLAFPLFALIGRLFSQLTECSWMQEKRSAYR